MVSQNTPLLKLKKADFLELDGFDTLSHLSQKDQKETLTDVIIDYNLSTRATIDDYKRAYNESKRRIQKQIDDQLFKSLKKQKTETKKRQRKQNIKETALEMRNMMNIQYEGVEKTPTRKEYERRIEEVDDHQTFKKDLQEYIELMKQTIIFKVDVGDDEDKRLALCESIRI
ncbi:hypothetical protein TRFO_18112 [Tritrichomonas foetus]|uniref:Uncharacterized protein n=1 Tax=Tritrichomonas foetus TaxID=1144522 RepID=A0A1J4KRW2_9EUKA|nr:hypothetical protein TRFO_18112 [Tritrichomonas foetus]|eukprot:OHT12205.1 hypothetical protein TRFO_18112 [Tritrichomonas foetus]